MDINITGRNFDLENSLKKYVKSRMAKLHRIYSRIYASEVIMEEEKLTTRAEIILYLKKNKLVAKGSAPDIYASFDQATESMKKQLRRLHGRALSKRRKSVFRNIIRPMIRFKIRDEVIFPEEPQGIIKTDFFADKPMLPEEAKLELQAMERNFIMFKNADTGEANVIYKRSDGQYGLIEPKF